MITEIEHPDGTKLVPFEGGWKVEAILEKNKWYRNKEYDNLVFYKSDNQDNYGFGYGSVDPIWLNTLKFNHELTWLPASEEEVKEALMEEAKRRGYTIGTKIKRDHFPHNKLRVEIDKLSFLYDRNRLEMGGYSIYEKGKWAEIISNPNEKILERIATIEKELEQLKRELK